ncbi:MAG: hypothetical protein ACD_12C00133G0001, partial [uncultured bacterium]
MTYRKTIFKENQSYHVFNRSINNEDIFINKREIIRFLSLINFYRFKTSISFSEYSVLNIDRKKSFEKSNNTYQSLVEIYSFSLMPNHYHFLIKQLIPNGISKFISNIQNGFAKYYNIKNKRYGSLFCAMFKAVTIRTDEQFFHVSRYIHLNPVIAGLVKINELERYYLTSFSSYMNNFSYPFLTKK